MDFEIFCCIFLWGGGGNLGDCVCFCVGVTYVHGILKLAQIAIGLYTNYNPSQILNWVGVSNLNSPKNLASIKPQMVFFMSNLLKNPPKHTYKKCNHSCDYQSRLANTPFFLVQTAKRK